MIEALQRWRYWLDFVWLPPVMALAVFFGFREPFFLPLFLVGVIGWTLAEYWVHRTVLHACLWHGTHEHHHDHPADYVETIWWYTPPFFVALFLILPLPAFAGFAFGYWCFLTMHHALHHLDLREKTWLHRYAIWHNRHHKLTGCNFGITTPVWDWAFGTSR